MLVGAWLCIGVIAAISAALAWNLVQDAARKRRSR